MITVRDLNKTFKKLRAVSDVSFDVPERQVLGLLGPNGAGKTTTMRMLTTFIQPTSGSINIAGYDLEQSPDEIRRNIGYLPETPPLYPELTVEEYLLFAARLREIAEKQVKSKVDSVIEMCALGNFRRTPCGVLSKGYKQRVGVAQAIIHNPKVIIFDEPTNGLDPMQIIEIRKLIKGLGAEHTVVLSSHILQEVAEVCSRVLIMANGKIVADKLIDESMSGKELEKHFIEAVGGGGHA